MSFKKEKYNVCTLKFHELVFSIIISRYDSFDILSVTTCWLTKKELYRKDTKDVSEKASVEVFSQFKESDSHSWSEFLYVVIQFASIKFENCLFIIYINF